MTWTRWIVCAWLVWGRAVAQAAPTTTAVLREIQEEVYRWYSTESESVEQFRRMAPLPLHVATCDGYRIYAVRGDWSNDELGGYGRWILVAHREGMPPEDWWSASIWMNAYSVHSQGADRCGRLRFRVPNCVYASSSRHKEAPVYALLEWRKDALLSDDERGLGYGSVRRVRWPRAPREIEKKVFRLYGPPGDTNALTSPDLNIEVHSLGVRCAGGVIYVVSGIPGLLGSGGEAVHLYSISTPGTFRARKIGEMAGWPVGVGPEKECPPLRVNVTASGCGVDRAEAVFLDATWDGREYAQ